MNKRLAAVGIAKQTAKGTPAGSPTYTVGLLGGALFSPEIEEDLEDLAWSERIAPYAIRSAVTPKVAMSSRAYVEAIGLLLQAALGSRTTSGAGPYTHVFALASALSTYHTLFGQLEAHKATVADAKLGTLTLSWERNRPVEVECEWMGCAHTFGSTWTVAGDQTLKPFFVPVGGTFQLEVAGATPAAAPISSGSLKVDNGLQARILSGNVLPADIDEGAVTVDLELTVVTADMSEWRKAVSGSATGTSPAGAAVYGSVDVTFAAVGSTETLRIDADRVEWLADFPEPDAAGGAAEIRLRGRVVKATGSAKTLELTLVNSVASY